MTTFVHHSRHQNISLVFISHEMSKTWQNNPFNRTLINNLSGCFVTTPTHCSTKQLWEILSQLIDIERRKLPAIVSIAQSISKYPYIFVSSKILGDDLYTRIQFKLFEPTGEMLKRERIVLFNKAGH